ncbi:MAG TPA: DUF3568 family protein [Longimicrobiales bacterium]|nr:DUF3568 family protein [Longimicrobiales bacterium]
MRRSGRAVRFLVAAMVLPLVAGCAAIAAGAIGAAAAIEYTDRGAESYVDASISEVASATESAFRSMGITIEERRSEPEEAEIEIKGDDGDWKVVTDIEGDRDAGRTHVEVTVSRNMVDYEKSRAEDILRAILDRL